MVNLLKELRPTILRMHSFGHKQQEIADALHISQQLVSKAIIRGTVEDRPGRGRKRTARTRENILKIKRKIQRNSSSRKNSARKMAHAHRISPMSVHRILAEELKLKSWKPLKRHDLTKKKRDCRKVRAPLLLNRFKNNRHRLLVFPDEKPFCIEQVLGSKSQGQGNPSMASWKRTGFHQQQRMAAVQPGSEPVGLRNMGLFRSKSMRKTPQVNQFFEESYQKGMGRDAWWDGC